MRAFRAAFDSAANPKREDVIGEWWLIQTVIAEAGLPDRIHYEATGSKRDDTQERPLDWKLLILRDAEGRLFQTSQYSWTGYPLPGDIAFADSGELWLDADFQGDNMREYRCRARTRVRLICLMRNAEDYEGREFLKVR